MHIIANDFQAIILFSKKIEKKIVFKYHFLEKKLNRVMLWDDLKKIRKLRETNVKN